MSSIAKPACAQDNMGLNETDGRKSSFYLIYASQKPTLIFYQSTRIIQKVHEVSVDSSSIVVFLARGRFKGKSEVIKSERHFFPLTCFIDSFLFI